MSDTPSVPQLGTVGPGLLVPDSPGPSLASASPTGAHLMFAQLLQLDRQPSGENWLFKLDAGSALQPQTAHPAVAQEQPGPSG